MAKVTTQDDEKRRTHPLASPNLNVGHRARLRHRFLNGGRDSLGDHELLEMVLFGAHPRGDVKPLAKILIKKFGGFAEVISAERQDLLAIKGMGEASVVAIKVVQAAALTLAREEILNRPVLSSWQCLIDYCRAAMSRNKQEQFRVLYLNRANVLIADEVQQRGTVDHAPVYPREVVKRALELSASAVIMVHNHPSGDPTPSRADIQMTREVQVAGESLGITVHDHIVVSRSGTTSFKAAGLL